MVKDNTQVENEAESTSSRRGFLQGAAALAVAAPALSRARKGRSMPGHGPVFAYVGTYSASKGPEGSTGHGRGIHLFELNPSSGILSEREVFPNEENPSWLAFNPSGTHLYAGNETETFEGKSSGSVSAYSVRRPDGRLTLLNIVSSEGAGPAHLSVHPSGKYVLVANYGGGTAAVLPIRPNGELGAATDVKRDEGKVGPEHPSSAPPGNFSISGHDHPHAHMIRSDPTGRYVLWTDLGLDRILVWKFDDRKGTLSPNDPPFVSLPPGDGPRHFAFHPNGHWMYSLQEEGSTVAFFEYDSASGRLTPKHTVSSLPKGFTGTNFPSEVRVSSDGKFLYAANRLHNSIAIYTIGASGRLTFEGAEWTRGDYPRNFNIDPTGNFLYACNQLSDAVTTFHINRKTGGLGFTGRYTPVGSPAVIIFLA